jgi:hypothetical protein
MNPGNFTRLCALFTGIDLFGGGPPPVPWNAGATPTAKDIAGPITRAANILPRRYREGYVDQLLHEVPSIAAGYKDRFSASVVEALAGAVYDHAPGSGVVIELRRFLAVVSDLYSSFLSKQRRTLSNIPVVAQLPPLVVFQSSGNLGPFTLPSDSVRRLIGSDVGVVSLPSSYRSHPVVWAALAHETGGHDVTHADPALLPELAEQVLHVFGGPVHWTPNPTPSQIRALVWSYWIDQATADIYGVLNSGPAFPANLAAFFSALNHLAHPERPLPHLRSKSGPNGVGDLDPHPTDILRIHLAIGVIGNLRQLSPELRKRAVAELTEIANACAQGATEIEIEGAVPVRDTKLRIHVKVPLAEWQEAARDVGALVVDTRLHALGGHSIQDIDTWDDLDEENAERIRAALKEDKSVVDLGNDAQLLSGATLALLDNPDLYASVTARVGEALDESFRSDALWGAMQPDRVYIPTPTGGI